jgi:hypothetical protein
VKIILATMAIIVGTRRKSPGKTPRKSPGKTPADRRKKCPELGSVFLEREQVTPCK